MVILKTKKKNKGKPPLPIFNMLYSGGCRAQIHAMDLKRIFSGWETTQLEDGRTVVKAYSPATIKEIGEDINKNFNGTEFLQCTVEVQGKTLEAQLFLGVYNLNPDAYSPGKSVRCTLNILPSRKGNVYSYFTVDHFDGDPVLASQAREIYNTIVNGQKPKDDGNKLLKKKADPYGLPF